MVIYILLILMLIFCTVYKSKRSLHMLQQNLYNENNRYIKWMIKNNKIFFDLDLSILLISLVGSFVFYDIEYLSFIGFWSIIVISFILGVVWNRRIRNDQNKKPLVYTKRVKRLIFTSSLFYLVPIVLLFMNVNNNKFCWLMVFTFTILIYLNYIIVYIANIINKPIEKMIFLGFRRKAKSKLRSMNKLKVIGITGSYGKTSSKNILSDILNIKYNALASPKNLNTPNGLMITINNHLDKFTDVFIAEMGAYVRGEIKELCDLVEPKYGILTRIGTAHLESFGSEENIIKGKFELIESLPEDGFAVLNGDDPKQVSYKLQNKVKTIWIGINNKNVDVRADNIKCSSKGSSFDVYLKGDENVYKFETKLLGDHNIYNILAGIAFGIEFGISMEELVQAVRGVRPVEHRLELKRLGNFYQIDDAYNSNPVGAEAACRVLGMMPGIRVVVTPGMIELGEKEAEYNKKFGEQIAEVADYVVLIGENKTKPIKEGLLTKGFDKEKIIVFNDVRKAYSFIGALTGNEEVYALFENDLPDTFNE